MSSTTVFNRLQSLFPQGILLDTGGNCFNLFMEFPSKDRSLAGVLIWEEAVIVYSNDRQYLSKEDYHRLNELLMAEGEDETFKNHEQVILTSNDISWDDDDNEVIEPLPNDVFDRKTMLAIGELWREFNKSLSKVLRGH
ncbi:hypothetical protein RS399_04050 [Bacillus inaquosorum]|uniref:hypothetical protein n=1 Tax=Bacillus inaquosorum TaxID=483913 RepID=UPI0028FC1AD4|nr:hypothetical protein [Bacillus inaquosorum]WNW25095.1 hypothetical protein RS399_04050 [Bacillus inaquosorum]